MSKEISLKEWAEKFKDGDFSIPVTEVQIEAGWYDWFCKDTSLARKTQSLGKKVLQLMKSPKINTKKSYVFFKNNCPMNGPLYDSFSICNIEDGAVQFWITAKSGHTGKAEVHGAENNFDGALAEGAWKDVKNFFEV